ncbi:MAG: hypothetical protein PW844_01670 [Pantoea sp.]|uniref:hypothetical protein n=1 Tax=Pantoea sp. TaxID=69393 RepID=UPI00239DC6F1|nr:hypothetical protein [Pantoea sp.]MDE1185177.1 hypothetical protein [Pantoea sp.]
MNLIPEETKRHKCNTEGISLMIVFMGDSHQTLYIVMFQSGMVQTSLLRGADTLFILLYTNKTAKAHFIA